MPTAPPGAWPGPSRSDAPERRRPAELPAGRRLAACLAAWLALGLLGGCSRSPEPLAENVILISIDTLRRDAVGCYGHDRPTSPNLDALCREAVVFDQAISHAPSTLLSHASMLTSLLPNRHGASFGARRPMAQEVVTLAEVLKERGFRTAAFNDGAQLSPRWDLHQGFDVWKANQKDPDTMERVVRQGLEWLDEMPRGEAPFFLFLHTYEVHHPYTPAAEDLERVGAAPYAGWLGTEVQVAELQRINRGEATADEADLAFIRAAYEAEIRSMDRSLGRLLAELDERGLLDSTLVVFTSDHGEEFGEHGSQGWHSHTLYDELLRVPLVFRFPGQRWAGRRVQRQVRLIDVAPTVLDSLGVPAPGDWQGVSLLDLLGEVEVPPLVAVSKMDTPATVETYSLRTGRWKLYDGRLFDLKTDPEERYDSATGNWDLVAALKAHLASLTAGGIENAGEPVELDPETRKRLEALGYL